jgi:hypothetical protein
MIELKKLWDSMPRDVQKKISLHDLKRTTDNYNTDPIREAARYAMQRMETIRETHPDIALDDDIKRVREALAPHEWRADPISPENAVSPSGSDGPTTPQ